MSDPHSKRVGSVLITGAARGLGREFARQFAAKGWSVNATVRSEADQTELTKELDGQATIFVADVCDEAPWHEIGSKIGELDLLVNNAGMNGPSVATQDAEGQLLGTIDYDAWRNVLETNLLGQVRVTEALLPALRKSAMRKIVFISSALGIISRAQYDKLLYRSSKVALNMAAAVIAKSLEAESFAVGALCPGWVQTKMGGANAPLAVDDAVRLAIANIERITVNDFVMRNERGEVLEW